MRTFLGCCQYLSSTLVRLFPHAFFGFFFFLSYGNTSFPLPPQITRSLEGRDAALYHKQRPFLPQSDVLTVPHYMRTFLPPPRVVVIMTMVPFRSGKRLFPSLLSRSSPLSKSEKVSSPRPLIPYEESESLFPFCCRPIVLFFLLDALLPFFLQSIINTVFLPSDQSTRLPPLRFTNDDRVFFLPLGVHT